MRLDLGLILKPDLKQTDNYYEYNNEEYRKSCANFQINIFKNSIPISKSQVNIFLTNFIF